MADNASTTPAPAPAAPALDLGHESPAVAAAMRHPGYFDSKHPQHKEAVEAAFAARQVISTAPAAPADGRVEGFSPHDVPTDGLPGHEASTATFPSEMHPVVQRSFQAIASEVGLGSRELSAIAKLAQPYMSDTTDYPTFESGERALRAQLGDKADAAIRDATAYTREFPEVLAAMRARKLGNHPAVVRVLAERWRARDGMNTKAAELRKHPQYYGPKPGQGNVDHAEARRLADEVAAIMAELHG